MKRFKIFYFIVLFWLSFFGHAIGKTAPVFRNFSKDRTVTKVQLLQANCFLKYHVSKLHYCKPDKKAKYNSLTNKGLKRKATPVESHLLADLYRSDFVTIMCFENNDAYGLTVLYDIIRHTHLHLYQLF